MMRTSVRICVRPPTVEYSPSWQNAQETRLRFERHVADFVEKERAALRLLEAADGARVGAGESPALVAEEFALDEFARDRRHVDGDEGTIAAAAIIMQRRARQVLCRCRSRP